MLLKVVYLVLRKVVLVAIVQTFLLCLSCFGKLFTAVLDHRLNYFLENMNLLCEEQAWFRKVYSTIDHILILNALLICICIENTHFLCFYRLL